MQALKIPFQVIGAIIGCVAIGAQLYIILQNARAEALSYAGEVIRFLSYMTIWTNILVALFFVCLLLFPGSGLTAFFKRPAAQAGMVLYVFVVAFIYHFLLADIWEPAGLQYIVDILLHYVMPLLYMLYWISFAPKGLLKFKNSFLWLVYPFAYMLYALGRGAINHVYPYPFIDVSQLGYTLVMRNALLISVAYLVLGMFLVFIDGRLSRFQHKKF